MGFHTDKVAHCRTEVEPCLPSCCGLSPLVPATFLRRTEAEYDAPLHFECSNRFAVVPGLPDVGTDRFHLQKTRWNPEHEQGDTPGSQNGMKAMSNVRSTNQPPAASTTTIVPAGQANRR